MFKKVLAVGLGCLVLAASGFAQELVGKWFGRLTVDWSKLPKMDDPQMKKQLEEARKMIEKIRQVLELKADKTYTSSMTGASQPATAEGTWAFAGDTLTLTPKKRNGKVVTVGEDSKPRKLTLSKDKKQLSMKMGSGEVTLVLVRA